MTESEAQQEEAALKRPIECIYCRDIQRFRVVRGKALDNAGFGYAQRNDASGSSTGYLFVEEVVYLHDRGTLDAYVIDEVEDASTPGDPGQQRRRLALSDLYDLLTKECGMDLAVYWVYQHLRAQTFRVVRHSPERQRLLEAMEERFRTLEAITPTTASSSSSMTNMEERRKRWKGDSIVGRLKQDLRAQVSQTAAPTTAAAFIAFDCYRPETNFAYTCPGLPDFLVYVTHYNSGSSLSFDDLQSLLRTSASLPLKIATVSDSGTVVMFAVSDFGVPSIKESEEEASS